MRLKENGAHTTHGCPDLHERTINKHSKLEKRVGMINIVAHVIATVIKNN